MEVLEIRSRKLTPGKYFLGHRSQIYGCAQLGEAFLIDNEEDWAALRTKHRVAGPRPYKKTWALPVTKVRRVSPVPYVHPRGAVGIVKYRMP